MKCLCLVAVLSAAALAGCGGGDDDTGGGGEVGGAGTADRPPAETDSSNAPQRIEMSEFAFSPGDLQLERGDDLL